jgi:hypothetical protein
MKKAINRCYFESLGDSPGDTFVFATPMTRNKFPSKSNQLTPPIEQFFPRMETNTIGICTFPDLSLSPSSEESQYPTFVAHFRQILRSHPLFLSH